MNKVCIAAGGTGGHIYPALAFAQILEEEQQGVEVVFLGTNDRMEASIVPQKGYRFYGLKASGLAGSAAAKARAVFQMLSAMATARKILKKEHPDLVVGFGGYVSAPVLLAASSLHIPVMMHEQNSIVGKANKVCAAKADAIVTCYEKAQEQFHSGKARLLGNPRASIAARATVNEKAFADLGLDPSRKTILVVMGSLGSSSVNELMKDALRELDPSLQILYVLGKDNEEGARLFEGMENVHPVGFVDTMEIYRMLDGMICRAGATTLAELTALGIPSILIPSPYVAENHQYYNAKRLADAHAALMIEEKDLNAKTLRSAIEQAFYDENNRKKLSANALALGKPGAAYDMIDYAREIAGHDKG